MTRALLVVFAGAAFGCGSAEGSAVAVADGPVPIAEVAPLNGKGDNHLMVLTSADAYRSYFGREHPGVDFAEEWVVHYSAKPGYGIAILGAEIRFGRLDIQTVSMPLDCAGDLTLKDNVTVRMPKQDPAAMPHVETRTIVASTCASLSQD